MAVKVIMPRLAAEMEEGTVTSWLVSEGGYVEKGQPLFQVESDKASLEVEAPSSGILRSVGVVAGTAVKCGVTIALIAARDEMVAQAPPSAGTAEAVNGQGVAVAVPASTTSRLPHRETPAARRVASELGVEIGLVPGTGPGGRVVEQDVRAYAEARKSSPAVAIVSTRAAEPAGAPFAQTAPVTGADQPGTTTVVGAEVVELSRLRRVTGERMLESVRQAPHFDLTVDVDMSEAARLRERWHNGRDSGAGNVSYTAILARAVARVLTRNPTVNASYSAGQLRQLKEINIGIAMSLKDGLIVPVIRNADRKGLAELSETLEELRQRGAEMRFRADDLSGGTFTISNLGMYGIDQFSAIINPPEAAILAVGQIAKRATVVDDQVVVRPMMTMTLSVDHRVLDGAIAAAFLQDLKQVLENPYLLI